MVNSAQNMENYLEHGINKREELVKRLHRVLVHDPISIQQLATRLGIKWQTAENLLVLRRKIRHETLYKLEAWLEKEEKRLGITI